jgi:hypothetical protein
MELLGEWQLSLVFARSEGYSESRHYITSWAAFKRKNKYFLLRATEKAAATITFFF